VDPASVEVLEPSAVDAGDRERGDPLVRDRGWRSVRDLDTAWAEGLVPPAQERSATTWEEMFDQLAAVARPLLGAGWLVERADNDDSWEFGDSVSYELERSAVRIEVDLYADGSILGYDLDQPSDVDEDPPPDPVFSLPGGASTEDVVAAFRGQGWIG
jgi:hypothetical protein